MREGWGWTVTAGSEHYYRFQNGFWISLCKREKSKKVNLEPLARVPHFHTCLECHAVLNGYVSTLEKLLGERCTARFSHINPPPSPPLSWLSEEGPCTHQTGGKLFD